MAHEAGWIALIFPPDTLFPLPSHSDRAGVAYSHTRHWRRLPSGELWATFTRDELEWALIVAEAIGANHEQR